LSQLESKEAAVKQYVDGATTIDEHPLEMDTVDA
jgi:hypothetical protein